MKKSILFVTGLLAISVISCGGEEAPAASPTLQSIRVGEYTEDYVRGDSFIVPKIIGKYSDGSEKEVSVTLQNFSGYDMEQKGEQTVTVTYEGKTTSFTILVAANVIDDATIEFSLENLGDNVSLHTDIQIEKFDNLTNEEIDEMYYATFKAKTDYTIPEPVHLKWEAVIDKGEVDKYKIEVSESATLTNPLVLYSEEKNYDLYNLKLDTTYYWRVSAHNNNVSDIASFKTNNVGPRFIYVDGVKNVRDLGGFGQIKQGLLYRGGAFEENDNGKIKVSITDKGADQLLNELKIKTEIDLRRDKPLNGYIENCGLTKSTVEGLNYIALPMWYGGKNVLTYQDDLYDDPAQFKRFFELAADINNYPMYFHCSHGKDRTGGIAYVVEALMGLDSNYLYRDYLASSLADKSYQMKMKSVDDNFGGTISSYLGEETELALSERTYLYLNEVVGVSTDTLDKVINILKA